MAHNIANIGGVNQITYQGSTPWHELGEQMPDGVHSIGDVIDRVPVLGLNVGLETMYLASGAIVPKRFAVVREGDAQVLGTVSEWYSPIQYRDAFSVFQPAIEQFGLTVEVAGALGSGEKAWMLFRLPTTVEPVAGDEINGYGVAITGHDGKTCFEFRPTPIRVVCQNTLNAAVGKGGAKGRMFGISHIGNTGSEVQAATKLVSDALAAMKETGETFAAMARKRITPQQVVTFIETVFPPAADGKVSDQLAERRKTVAELVWTGVGSDLAMSETNGEPNPWAVYNAVTEYFDHVAPAKSAKTSKRANTSALFGTGADLKLFALQAARELVAAN